MFQLEAEWSSYRGWVIPMAAKDQDQRHSYRFPVDEGLQGAELKAGSRRIAVRLVDESAGGFAVASERPIPVQAGELLELRTAADRFEVRVIHLTKSRITSASLGWTNRTVFEVGLERVREIPRSLREEVPSAGWWPSDSRHALVSPKRGVGEGIVFTLLVVLFPAAIILVGWNYQRPLGSWLAQYAGRWIAPSRSDLPSQTVGQSSRDRSANSAKPASTSGEAAAPRPNLEALGRMVRRLPDASALILPEVAEYLSLDDGQRSEIRRIAEATANAVEETDGQSAATSPERRGRNRLDWHQASRQQALSLLNKQQRERWTTLARTAFQSP